VVSGPSMVPTLHHGDRVLVRWGARVGQGDVVVARRPDRPDLLVVKRAARPEGRGWWLTGDNPFASDDSATFGAVPAVSILGRVFLRYRPFPPRRLGQGDLNG
jgi:nickel-type superoxide dismutase maturation protease